MQKKHDEGFSLIEILVAIVILAAFVVPICSALLMTNEMNNRTDALMQAQLNVSSAVETLMAEGIPSGTEKTDDYRASVLFPNVKIAVEQDGSNPWFCVTVTSTDELVTVKTTVRAIKASGGGA
jgi:prepilin-type N-terminal cleavage/methylation domain-containing protein